VRCAVLAVLAFFALTSSAGAAPFVIGTGDTPAVAVAANGTAYIAWNGADAQDTPTYCRLPRGATACDVALTLPVTPGTGSVSRPHVSLLGGRVSILVHRYGEVTGIVQYTSTDGGVSFTSRLAGGNVPIYESADGPGDSVSVVTNADGRGGLYQSVPLASGTATAFAAFGTDRPYAGAVGMDGANPVVAFGTAIGDLVRVSRYSGAGDPNAAASWSPPVEIGYATYPRLAGGPLGLFLLAGDGAGGLFVRRFSAGTFGAPVTIAASGDSSEMHLHQDPAGRLHAVYPRLDAAGYHAQHAVSDDGVAWTTTELASAPSSQQGSMRVAAAPDHIGVAVWENGTQIEVSTVSGASADPQFGRTVVVTPSGTVRVRLRGSSRFVALTALDDVPFGSTIDARRGAVVLRARTRRNGPLETVRLFDGMFRISQSRNVVNFTLNEPLASCRARAAQKKAKSRKLWGDGKGAFRTTGRYSAATVRGTRWLVQDTCKGTLTRVTQGSVSVRHRGRTVVVRAGKRYLARPRR
jgi:hypothetical protein